MRVPPAMPTDYSDRAESRKSRWGERP